LYELVPPALAGAPIFPIDTAMFIFTEEDRSTEIKYGEKGVIVEVVDRCTMWSAEHEPDLVPDLLTNL
jgi:hypothetical protein